MSGGCGNCNCADQSQCVKKGNQYGFDIIENENNNFDGMVMEEGGNCDNCKCGSGCACTSCTCCSH
ncbi:hypothetical protein BVRB_4g096800 [Beta vulgaris subsp. vulgaris]|uniref:Metallothionein-like protein n=1 Tax=Beta vulgaris subsp. vulgaris TaxID=3555 RepID=A0A0J8BD79_BETVV|nr:hypothetical protein BVRB_4g096800 [Beta vulgaris subsp. vulgaris]